MFSQPRNTRRENTEVICVHQVVNEGAAVYVISDNKFNLFSINFLDIKFDTIKVALQHMNMFS